MAYTKTAWVNGGVPALNDTNLNKIEQGIADAHTVLGLKIVDPGGNGDYTTIDAAIADSSYQLFLVKGTHTVTTSSMLIDAGTNVVLIGEDMDETIVDISATTGQVFRANIDTGGDFNKYPTTGTFTSNGKDLTFVGSEDLTTIFNAGDVVVIGNAIDSGASIVNRVTSTVLKLDELAITSLNNAFFGQADYVWNVGSCGFIVENLTFDGDGGNKILIRESTDQLVYWDVHVKNVRCSSSYIAFDYDTAWRSYYEDYTSDQYHYFATRAFHKNCRLNNVYIDSPRYGGDAVFVGCTISRDEGGDWLAPYCTFDACKFGFDLTTSNANTTNSQRANLVDCVDINGAYIQPVASVTYGSAADATINPDVANSGSAVAYNFDTLNTLTSTAKIFSFSNNGTEAFSMRADGIINLTDARIKIASNNSTNTRFETESLDATGNYYSGATMDSRSAGVGDVCGWFAYLGDSTGDANDYDQQISLTCAQVGGMELRMQEDTRVDQITGQLLWFQPQIADGASATAYVFKSGDDLANATAKIASFSNQNTEVMSIAKGGVNVTGSYSVNGNAGASGTGTTITSITVENGIVTAISVS